MSGNIDYSSWRLVTSGGIRYKLFQGYPRLSGDENGAKATEVYIIRAQDVNAFYVESLPVPYLFGGIVIRPPRRRMPGSGILITRSVSFEPFTGMLPGDPLSVDPTAPDDTYEDYYRVTIEYSTDQESDNNTPDAARPITFLERSVDASGEFLHFPTQSTTIIADSDTQQGGAEEDNPELQMPIVKTVPMLEWQMRWSFVVDPDWATFVSLLGTVNSTSPDWLNSPTRGTVLFQGVSGRQKFIWDGASASEQPWDLDFKFAQKQVNENNQVYGWNYVYAPKKGKWVRIIRADGSNLYAAADHEALFGN